MSWYRRISVSIFTFLLFWMPAGAQTIRTVAGSGAVDSLWGDGGPATAASMGQLFSVAVDYLGNIYICSNSDNGLRKVTPDGIIHRLCNDSVGYPRYAGDGGPATAASLNSPFSVATDRFGNVFIADANSHRIRKIDTHDTITTVAGSGAYGFSGDGGAATNAAIGSPGGVAVDYAGNIYIADANTRVRKVNTAGIITTIAGTGAVGYSGDGGPATAAVLDGPIGVTTDLRGNVYIADKNNDVIRKINTSGIISRFAGNSTTSGFSGDGGQASSCKLSSPNAVRCDQWGNIYIADQSNQRIRRVDTNGVIRTIAGRATSPYNPGFAGDGGPATAALLANPSDIAFDNYGNIYIADKGRGVAYSDGHRIRQIFKVDTFHLVATPDDTVCGRLTVSIYAVTTVPHFNAQYQWRLNGSIVGFDSAVYRNAAFADGDIITCTIIDPNYSSMVLAVSDTVKMVVHPAVIPRLYLSTTGDSLCAGETVTLSATALNGGPTPRYSWYRFGVLVGTGPVLNYVPAVGDIITCILTSSAVCATPDTAMASRPMVVNVSYPPDVSVVAHPDATVSHYGDIVTMLTETTYGGSAPTFQWYKNGAPISGATNESYFQEVYWADTIYCVMHSNLPCVVPEYDTSNVTYLGIGKLAVENVGKSATTLSVYPNPNTGSFIINGLSNFGTGTAFNIAVRDINGQIVYSKSIDNQAKNTLPFALPADIADGLYYISVTSSNSSAGVAVAVRH